VLLLDWHVPGISGLEVLARIRGELHSIVPAVMVTSRNSEEDVVEGLRKGADDFIAKPYRPAELLARVESVVRHNCYAPAEVPLHQGGLCVELASRRIILKGVPVKLSTKDYDLAVFMLRRVGRLLPRKQILDSVWGPGVTVTSRTLDTHISRIRIKLGLTEENGWELLAVYGEGYRLERMMR
jgi:DNA-binding response OmpR family regulator